MLFPASNAESPRPLYGPWHGQLVSIVIGLVRTKLVRMWNRLGEACVDNCAKIGLVGECESRTNKGKWSLFYSCFGVCRCCNIKSRYVRCASLGENRQQLVNSTANCRVEGWQVSRRFVTRLFHGPWCPSVLVHKRIRIYAVPCGIWSIHWRWSHWIYTNQGKINKRRNVW